MIKFQLPFYLLIIVNFSFAQKSLSVLIKENEQSVFLVQCFNYKNEMVSTGSGFFIDKIGTAYTNVHVIKEAYYAKIKTVDGKFYDVEKLLDYNSNFDIAKIKIKNPIGINFIPIKVAINKAEKGDQIFTIGNPDGLESSVSSGIISSIRLIPDYGECYQITASISPGSSGGALFNMNGEVIGITSFGQIDPNRLNQNLNFAVNINNAKYLNQNLNLSIDEAYKKISYENFIPAYMKFELNGDYDNAIKACTDQLRMKPNDGIAYHLRATTLLTINEFDLAENDFNKSLLYNNVPQIKEWDYIGLGKIYRQSRQYLKSKECYLKALEINSHNAKTFCNLALLASEWLGRDNEMVYKSAEMALQLDELSCPFAFKVLAEATMQKGDFERAILYLTSSIATESDKKFSVNEYYNRGTCYYKLKKYDSATADFQICIAMNSYDAQSFHWLGLCYIELGRKTDACSAFNKALEINKSFNQNLTEGENILKTINFYCK